MENKSKNRFGGNAFEAIHAAVRGMFRSGTVGKETVDAFDATCPENNLMTSRKITLTKHLAAFVDNQVATGRHGSASEVVGEALRRYEVDIAEHLKSVQNVIREGRDAIRRGEFRTIATAEDTEALRLRIVRR